MPQLESHATLGTRGRTETKRKEKTYSNIFTTTTISDNMRTYHYLSIILPGIFALFK